MSLIAPRAARRALPLCARAHAARAFSASVYRSKTATETVKDGLKTVDRAVTDHVVLPGLEAAATAGRKVKQSAEAVTHKGKASEVKGQVKGMAEEVKGQVKGKAEEVKGQVKGKAEEVKSQVKGKAEEVKGKAEETAAEVQGKVKGAAEEAKRDV
ncbi:uncharacterized protein UV8b_07386 [Ustilaginoidea virens]|uniref:LEA domain protein n=1 Tax=Ustilaginoidea virens TaxID=1159556 RepID=A0A8E5HXD8_USTVR|nr:uncharacterized protein UV8b_07386 [Ustilaginoidea virens]QUC23145.1 hypothetical protein UV8b_07386 [Ustilaginoidea virens]